MEKNAMRVRLGLAALLLAGCLLMAGLQNAHAAAAAEAALLLAGCLLMAGLQNAHAAAAAEAAQPETTAARELHENAPPGGYKPEKANEHSKGCSALHGCRG